MKKIILAALLIAGHAVAFYCCTSPQVIEFLRINCGTNQADDFDYGCWVDEDTFHISAVSLPKSGAKTIKEKQETARNTAVLNAQYSFLQEISRERVMRIEKKFPAGSHINYSDSNLPQDVFKNVMKNGIIIKEKFSSDGSCNIIFEIKEKDLKKKITDYIKRYDNWE